MLFKKNISYSNINQNYWSDLLENFKISDELIDDFKKEKVKDFRKNKDNVQKWSDEHYQKILDSKLNKKQKDKLRDFTASRYDPINEYLRITNGKLLDPSKKETLGNYKISQIKRLNEEINEITTAIKKTPTPWIVNVYRRESDFRFGMDNELRNSIEGKIDRAAFRKIKDQFEGRAFIQDSFMSTSLTQDPHKSYGPDRYPVLLKIKIPKGTEATYIAELSKYPDQMEFLINRGSMFKYDQFKIIAENGKETVLVEVSLIK